MGIIIRSAGLHCQLSNMRQEHTSISSRNAQQTEQKPSELSLALTKTTLLGALATQNYQNETYNKGWHTSATIGLLLKVCYFRSAIETTALVLSSNCKQLAFRMILFRLLLELGRKNRSIDTIDRVIERITVRYARLPLLAAEKFDGTAYANTNRSQDTNAWCSQLKPSLVLKRCALICLLISLLDQCCDVCSICVTLTRARTQK